ncbi:MAG: hypothetical protein JNN15_15850 [Blastocatellia bacterium]|nr:hypothetical protein [Blastocatellia bacterium]
MQNGHNGQTDDFVEVNVEPYGDDSAFGIELKVKDSQLNADPFEIILSFQLEEGDIPGLNEDATNDPEQIFDLAKGLLLCNSEDVPELAQIPTEDCPPSYTGYYYNLSIEMELSDDDSSEGEIREQEWQVSVFHSAMKNAPSAERLFEMIQGFFSTHL